MDYKKLTRLSIGILSFMCLMTINGIPIREAHQFIYMLGIICVFGFILKNIWISLFLWWTVFLFSYFKFNFGWIYLANVFYGCVLYYVVKKVFKREHIGYYINILLWVLVLNILYGSLQVMNLDFIFEGGVVGSSGGEALQGFFTPGNLQGAPIGLMANTSVMASFIVLCIPLLMSKRNWIAYTATALLIIPLYCLHSFTSLVVGIITIIFMLFFIVPKKVWFILMGLLIIGFICTFRFVDLPGIERLPLWRLAMIDARQHPIIGWGLDSFRSVHQNKQFTYNMGPIMLSGNKVKTGLWDNPHNLYISIAYEFGFIGLLIMGGYIRQLCIWFKNATKDNETLALFGFIIALLVVSMGQFPLFLARMAIFIIPVFALFELKVRDEYI